MDDNERNDESWRQEAAGLEAQWKQQATAEAAWWVQRAAAQQDEQIRQYNLMYGGLIGIGIVMVQPFLTAPAEEFDLTAKICVIAFSVTIPILAALVVLNSQETYRRRMSTSIFVQVTRQVAFGTGVIGVVAGLWHMTPAAGVAFLVAAGIALAVQSVGYLQVERADARAASKADGGESPPTAAGSGEAS